MHPINHTNAPFKLTENDDTVSLPLVEGMFISTSCAAGDVILMDDTPSSSVEGNENTEIASAVAVAVRKTPEYCRTTAFVAGRAPNTVDQACTTYDQHIC